MTTWGGRRYFAEEPRMINGALRSFAYRLFNYLVQGSSADITKEAVIRYDEAKTESRLVLTVHDQLITCCPMGKAVRQKEMSVLKEAMNGIPLGAPLTSDGSFGYRWTEQEECE